jgi:hypothetical protein
VETSTPAPTRNAATLSLVVETRGEEVQAWTRYIVVHTGSAYEGRFVSATLSYSEWDGYELTVDDDDNNDPYLVDALENLDQAVLYYLDMASA